MDASGPNRPNSGLSGRTPLPPGHAQSFQSQRIALFGGTFDPPHRGHVAVALAAANSFHLDQVLFAPAGRQPLKHEPPLASYQERINMVALACAADPRFAVSRLDAPHPDGTPNYTIHALQALREEWPDARLFNIVGADSFATLAQWHDPIRLLSLAEWIVVSRPGIGLAPPPGLSLTAQQLARIHPLDTLHEDVSATELRHRLHAGDACTDLLPPEVDRYIQQKELYR